MSEQIENLLVGMADAGCSEDEIKGAERLMNDERFDDLTKHLKRCRATLLDRMHESQKRVDCMDHLIRQTEKTQQNERTVRL